MCRAGTSARRLRGRQGPGHPDRYDLTFPKEDTEFPYFTSWIKQQVVDQLGGGQQGARRRRSTAACGVTTTIDSKLQTAAEKAIQGVAAQRERPARVAGRHLQQGRHGPGDGRRRQVRGQRRSTSPPRASASPGSAFKPLRARRGAQARHQPRLHLGVEEADLHPQGRASVSL